MYAADTISLSGHSDTQGNAWTVSCEHVDPSLAKWLIVAVESKSSNRRSASTHRQRGSLEPLVRGGQRTLRVVVVVAVRERTRYVNLVV